MILRKPYAFLVKHFKLIHTILTLIIAYLVYRTNMILSFLNEYISSNQTAAVDNLTNSIFNIWMFFLPFLIIVLSLIIISVMYSKKKPIVLYIFNILLAIFMLVLFNLSYSLFTEMEAVILETRNIRLFRDFVTILELLQSVSMLFLLVRATGFDIKKFNFNQDLDELEITEADREEFEVNIDVNTNEFYRQFKRALRFSKYVYRENKFLIDIGIMLGISAICFLIYMNVGIYEREVKQNTIFSTTSFHLGVTNSYITNKNYRGITIDENNRLVILELNIKSKGVPRELDTATVKLEINGQRFYHTEKYKEEFMDLGQIYQDSEIATSFEKQLLVFKIPKEYENEKMTFTYVDKIDYIANGINSKYVRVAVTPMKIDSKNTTINETIENELSLKDSVLKETKLKIETAQIQKEFRESYSFCITKDECYPSAEFIMPNYNSNEEKAILKLKGSFTLDEHITLHRVYSFYHFIYYFSTLKYEKNGEIKTQKVTMSRINPTKFELADTYYIEVSADVIDAEKIWLDFHIRNKEYLYQIR